MASFLRETLRVPIHELDLYEIFFGVPKHLKQLLVFGIYFPRKNPNHEHSAYQQFRVALLIIQKNAISICESYFFALFTLKVGLWCCKQTKAISIDNTVIAYILSRPQEIMCF